MVAHDETPVSTTPAQQLWETAVCLAAIKARKALPESATRVDKAMQLVLGGSVEIVDDHSARVTSQHGGETHYFVVNGACQCPDYARAPQSWCKHRLARALTVKALQLAKELSTTTAPAVISQPGIPAQFLYERGGTTAILWGGLLHMGHAAGLQSLSVEVVTVTQELAVMRATARFANGQVWSDIGDATPANVGPRIAPHFIRMASTRAMARCLRTALDIPYVCAAELEGD